MKKIEIDDLIKEHRSMEIPVELDFLVKRALTDGKKELRRRKIMRNIKVAVGSAAATILIFTAAINTSPAFADTMSRIPMIDGIVKVLTITEHSIHEDGYNAEIETPTIEGLKDQDLQSSLNNKYLEESKLLYEQFIADMEEIEANGGGHLGVDSGYEIKADNDRILSIGRYVVNTVGSSSTTYKFDTIDKEKEVLITLPGLFIDDSYLQVISNSIMEQMILKNKEDENNHYWLEGIEESNPIDLFSGISKEQNFYINNDYKLVISFDKYEVAPGYMGIVEFEIPTDLSSHILVGSEYIR